MLISLGFGFPVSKRVCNISARGISFQLRADTTEASSWRHQHQSMPVHAGSCSKDFQCRFLPASIKFATGPRRPGFWRRLCLLLTSLGFGFLVHKWFAAFGACRYNPSWACGFMPIAGSCRFLPVLAGFKGCSLPVLAGFNQVCNRSTPTRFLTLPLCAPWDVECQLESGAYRFMPVHFQIQSVYADPVFGTALVCSFAC